MRSLQARGLMKRKGFPESYDLRRLVQFVSDIKSGVEEVRAPVYSHTRYDIVDGESHVVTQPDILILEGLNVLQSGNPRRPGSQRTFVSDFFDFSIYVDADERDIENWYVERFMTLRETVFRDPDFVLQPLRRAHAGRSARGRARHLVVDQPGQPAREHPADPRASAPDPRQGRDPRRRAGAVAAAVTNGSWLKAYG